MFTSMPDDDGSAVVLHRSASPFKACGLYSFKLTKPGIFLNTPRKNRYSKWKIPSC